MTNATQLAHYSNYPVCGFCYNAWDLVYGRTRSSLSPDQWASMCPYGGCDPEIWDYFTDETGWPEGWQLDGRNMPLAYSDPKKYSLVIPPHDNRVFHMRKDQGPAAPWRATSQRLLREAQRAHAQDSESRKLENVFEDDEDEDLVSVASNSDPVEDLDADDLW